jgi:hypothetical protein
MNLKLTFASRSSIERAGQDASVRSHQLTFHEPTPPGALTPVGHGTNSLTITVTKEVSDTFVLGDEYDIAITPSVET